jgi:hypothetical protein
MFNAGTDYSHPGQIDQSRATWEATKIMSSHLFIYLACYAAIRASLAAFADEPIPNKVSLLWHQPLTFESCVLFSNVFCLWMQFDVYTRHKSLNKAVTNETTHRHFNTLGIFGVIFEFVFALRDNKSLLSPVSQLIAVLAAAKLNYELWAYAICHYAPDVEAVPSDVPNTGPTITATFYERPIADVEAVPVTSTSSEQSEQAVVATAVDNYSMSPFAVTADARILPEWLQAIGNRAETPVVASSGVRFRS